MRLDKLLWYLRFAKTRSLAQTAIVSGHIRLNRRRVDRPAQRIAVGDILVLPVPQGIHVIEITALPGRRGPAAEASSCYRTLDAAQSNLIAADESPPAPSRTEDQEDRSS
ncbi:MAG: RNA-binding S4 domain-containing protein [Sphingomonadales bacterium]|nr:RNA-binding S4 domain-containing protein [Sphingomonadales bacterium]MBU3992647.1 RNA-binding S4 domain-containing protein [Alphaproteobacteria bacterium]